jgi:hypothetical protein
MAPPGGSSLTDPTVQISRSGFLKRDSLFKSRAADPRLQQRVSAAEGIVFRPRQPRPAGSAIEPLAPEFAGAPIELPETLGVRGSPVVLIVAPELGIEGFLLLAHRCMSVLLAPCTCTVNFPRRLRAQMCVNPRKSKVLGFFPCRRPDRSQSSSVSLTLSTQLHSVPDRFRPTLERQDECCRDVGTRETLAQRFCPLRFSPASPTLACLTHWLY